MKNYTYMFAYVRFDEYDMNSYRNEYLRLLGGQSHAQCEFHITPLITCYKKSKVCSCGKNAIFCCSEDNCNVSICKMCFNELNSNDITFIKSNNNVS